MAADLELLTRRGCHLCEDAVALLEAAGLHPVLVDIDLDLALLAEFDHRVPVLRRRDSGRILAEGILSSEAVAALDDC